MNGTQAHRQPLRGILKNKQHPLPSPQVTSNTQPSMSPVTDQTSTDPSHHPSHVVWDEESLQDTESLRGTRMKIDEPKTPFVTYEDHTRRAQEDEAAMEDDLAPITLSASVDLGDAAKDHEDTTLQDDWETDEEDEDENDLSPEERNRIEEAEQERHERFAKMRAQHYNMREAFEKPQKDRV
ncbi:hypothetical protein BJ684DRAFT_21168 [Piptocephalis cylindrospora]|uniref:Uncharacterized protein n=1 Tax=Piptocephalis cylindrospora TaxID=1907219 RepID=A0A4P9Y2K2_9FUNG|nr:hypothetical protein BJ684DRAFT_21168 [Piptocephalis cylindrospora]|eukprot:RKP12281.1 hypothetical protein BJ684DRAFT_21168 [Piptocephalis cylindrospora]